MTSMWAAFVHEGNPNDHGQFGIPERLVYANNSYAQVSGRTSNFET